MIRFLIKSVFYLFFVFVIISFFTTEPNSNSFSTPKDTETTTNDAITALKGAINDLLTFCERNTETCDIGKSFLESIGAHARDGAKIVYEYLNSTFGNKNMTQPENSQPLNGYPQFHKKIE
ncbi:DUF5330 domain-containing protein [Bartonella sp. A05]|uniref:DUF5330 domain-containing protein n=1 Tax=Bartonella sp. A05 TaxID=2967261 RepID=UPI0022A96F80|nr:DUF5330 domain-containing protein [Bartonella sp. A05]MCZ2203858.1 DUF5330 domain-containing protein [Bartonella sp. A05]